MIILKNAYILTFNKNLDFGRYSVLINDNKITDIADSTPKGASKVDKWIELHSSNCEIVDCTMKLIMPPLVNSCQKSEGSLLHYLLKRRHYEKAEEDICTDLIFNYIYQELPSETTQTDLANIYDYSFNRALKSGVEYINEFSLRKDTNHYAPVTNAFKNTGQKITLCYPIKQDINLIRDYKYLNPSYYLTQENLLTVYDISNITELRSYNLKNLFLEAAVNKEITERFKQTFHKSLIALLDEYQLINSNTSLINPLYLEYSDLKIITERKANIIICPRDLSYFSNRYFPIDDYIGHDIKFSIGTGWLGEDLLKEVRLFRNKYKELNISSIDLLYSITKIPHELYFNFDQSGDQAYGIDINKPADMIFIDLNDLRFQFFPEEFSFESVCDFIIDNLTSFNVSDVMTGGMFTLKNNKPANSNENEVITRVNVTRNRLYKTGKYDELKKRKQAKENSDKLDMGSRSDDEIKLFSEKTDEVTDIEATEEFRIKTKLPVFRQKAVPGQRSLFEQIEQSSIILSDELCDTPELNLLITDPDASKQVEDDIIQASAIDETIIRRLGSEKKAEKDTKHLKSESKVELPKNVKLKFGDD
ncbi:MAG: amidohydrolase family protein [Ignavibacteria bacterium]|nr:amidohydrolase family protein [Ignavibacteria bacterium]